MCRQCGISVRSTVMAGAEERISYDAGFSCGIMDTSSSAWKIGRYLAEQVVAFNNEWTQRPGEYRILGDSPAIGIMLYNDCGEWEWKPAPEFDETMNYVHTGKHRPIRVYKNIDARFILEDLYAKLELAANA